MFNSKDIADYYNQTLHHYTIWWKLKNTLAVHYGYWEEHTKTFDEALLNTNKKMAELVSISKNDMILDAGCGVGGTAIYLAKTYGCQIKGITLSQKQIDFANQNIHNNPYSDQIEISLQDFSNTNFPNQYFDAIWGCESTCYANPKSDFVKEARRLLKPGGKIVIADYFTTTKGQEDADHYMKNWGDLWAIDLFHSHENFIQELALQGFKIIENKDVSAYIFKSAKRMYYAYLIGAIPSIIYNLFHNTSKFGKYHYKSGYYQFIALKNKLWTYRHILAEKI